MILYHGGTVAVIEPRIIFSDLGRDFGPAFYGSSCMTVGIRSRHNLI